MTKTFRQFFLFQRHYKFFIFLLFFILFSFGSFFFFHNALAQENEGRKVTGVQVSPLRYDWNFFMNDGGEGVIKVKNNNEKPYFVEVQAEDFEVGEDSDRAKFFIPDDEHPLKAYDVINWFSFSDKNFELQPGEVKEVKFSVRVPDKTPTGGYYGAIFFKYVEKEEDNENIGSVLNVNTRIGVLVTMAVKGTEPISRNSFLHDFTTRRKIFFDSPVTFTSKVTNDGNIHFKLKGDIDIYRFGKKKDSIEIEKKIVYPGKVRALKDDWKFGLLNFGHYEARALFQSEEGDVVLRGSTKFWIIPWKTVAAVFSVLIFLFLLYKAGHYSGKRKSGRY